MRIPGPAEVLTIPSLVQKGVSHAAQDVNGMVDVLRRAGDLTGRTERLVHRMETLVSSVAEALERVEALMDDVEATTSRADELITQSLEVTARAGQTIDQARHATSRTTGVLDSTEGLLERTDGLLGPWSEISDRMHPWAAQVSGSVEAIEVEAMISVIDRLPRVAQHLDEDVVPLLGQLEKIRPDVQEILQTVNDLSLAIKGVPGMGLFKRRGEMIEGDEGGEKRQGNGAPDGDDG